MKVACQEGTQKSQTKNNHKKQTKDNHIVGVGQENIISSRLRKKGVILISHGHISSGR